MVNGCCKVRTPQGDFPPFPHWHVGLSRVDDDLVSHQYSGPIHGRNGTKNRRPADLSTPTLLSVNSKCLLVSHHRVVRYDTWLTGAMRAHQLFFLFRYARPTSTTPSSLILIHFQAPILPLPPHLVITNPSGINSNFQSNSPGKKDGIDKREVPGYKWRQVKARSHPGSAKMFQDKFSDAMDLVDC